MSKIIQIFSFCTVISTTKVFFHIHFLRLLNHIQLGLKAPIRPLLYVIKHKYFED